MTMVPNHRQLSKKARKGLPLIIGRTHNGVPIIGNLFRMADTHGFPLVCSMDECYKSGAVPGLPSYVCDAVLAAPPLERGKAQVRALARVREALVDRMEGHKYEELEEGLLFALRDPEQWSTKGMIDSDP